MFDLHTLPDSIFPDGFVWGSSTAGHQIEGNNTHSNWWHKEVTEKWDEPSGIACDHWNRWKEDFDLLISLGHRAYRMSVEWSRVEPEEGVRDERALAQYLEMLSYLKERGVKICVTLHHFTHPQWFEEKGAFTKVENLPHFQRHVDFIVPKLAPYVDFWNVINEFNLHRSEYAAPFKESMLRAHAHAYRVIKSHSEAPVSTAHAFVHYQPRRYYDAADRMLTDYMDWEGNEFFFHAIRTGELVLPFADAVTIPELKGAMDFWSVNYYTRHMIDARLKNVRGERYRHKSIRFIDRAFYLEEMFPEALVSSLERITDLPIYITENGMACDDDRWRILYMALHFNALREAIDRGADVRGFFHWSLLDNYEWGSFVPRFGLVSVDRETMQRTPKPSAAFFREVIEANGVTQALIRKHIPDWPEMAAYR
jgi:beta-glucosidase